jgi:hypothetical protein
MELMLLHFGRLHTAQQTCASLSNLTNPVHIGKVSLQLLDLRVPILQGVTFSPVCDGKKLIHDHPG